MVELRRTKTKGGLQMANPNYDFKITLEACRVNANLKQRDLADKLGVSRATIGNWEKGKTSPTVPQLEKISLLTGVPINFIFIPALLQ